MIRQILKYGKIYTAIEHAEKGVFNLLQLRKKKHEFVISKNKQTDRFDILLEELKGQKHLFLILNDAQILSKKVASISNNEKVLIRNAFPTITLTDFYYEVYQNTDHSFVCIARKKHIDKVINTYQQKGISVIDFSLGNLVLQNLQPFVENKTLFSSNAAVKFDTKAICSIEKASSSGKNYSINDLQVADTEILPLAGIICYYTKNKASIRHTELKKRYFHKRFFNLSLQTGLSFFLGLLLINFFFFSSYRNRVNTITGELQLSETYKNQLHKLQEEVTQKKHLVASVQSASNSKLSLYIDELGISTPQTILLSQFYYQPIVGIQKKDNPISFKKNQIIVKGISKENEDFSNWISLLEQKKWVKNISIHAYGKGKKTTRIAVFKFIITTHD
ncbi:MAG: hypothetical protein P8H93_03590 [Polaribacter sp.]|nr:hypothetical protein [Polaribacter sp.]